MMSRSSKKQDRQKAFQHHSSQQHKKGPSTSLHIYYTGAGVVYVYKQRVSDNHPKQHNKTPQAASPIFTAIDVETGLCMAAQIEDKTQSMQYLSTCIQQFLIECGRTHAVLNNTVLQPDNWGFPHSTSESNSHSNGKQPSSTTITSIHRTSTRQRRTFPLNTYGTSESTQATS